MTPSCSAYAREAIAKHGPITGWILTCDRLMRCGRDEITQAKSIRINHTTLCHDPVANNDFWMK
jgi:putative component of membrane protein insertase Oxa1/YidC/SpoIIIJ protein YidD